MWKKNGAGLLLLGQVSACNSNTCYLQAQPATRGIPVHAQKTSSAKRLLVRGEVDRFCHWHHRRRETADYRWARTNRPKKWKRPTCQFRSWSSKSQEAKMMHDVLQPTEIALRRSSRVAHLYARLDRCSKAWVNSQDLLPFAWFLLVDFSLEIAIDDATGHTRSGAKKYRTQSRKKVSGHCFKIRSVWLVEAQTFCLALLFFSYSFAPFVPFRLTKCESESWYKVGCDPIHVQFRSASLQYESLRLHQADR